MINLALRMEKYGFETVVATGTAERGEEDLADELAAAPQRVERIPGLRRDVSPLLDLWALRGLKKLILEFKPDVIHTHTSKAGALGWMQIMPFHFPRRGALPGKDNWAVPAVSIGLGDRILTENRRRFDGDPYLAVAAYNAGPGAAERWRRQLGGSPTPDIYLAWIGYPETRNYVEKVLIDREIYDWILAGRPGE